jgi:flagellar motor switch protein FliG
MSSISRYKKAGGFIQLVSLIETFGAPKREKFIEMIDAESPVWAKALRDKMLSIERIFSWSAHHF